MPNNIAEKQELSIEEIENEISEIVNQYKNRKPYLLYLYEVLICKRDYELVKESKNLTEKPLFIFHKNMGQKVGSNKNNDYIYVEYDEILSKFYELWDKGILIQFKYPNELYQTMIELKGEGYFKSF